MKQRVVYYLLFTLFLVIFTNLFILSTHASQNIVLANGAQVRTTGNQGIRFIAEISEVSDYEEYGFVCAKGTYSFEELQDAFNAVLTWTVISGGNVEGSDNFVYSSGSANGIKLVRTSKANNSSGSSALTLTVYNITEANYLKDLSVFVFGKKMMDHMNFQMLV